MLYLRLVYLKFKLLYLNVKKDLYMKDIIEISLRHSVLGTDSYVAYMNFKENMCVFFKKNKVSVQSNLVSMRSTVYFEALIVLVL